MNPKGHLDEYLLNDVGKVYKGSYKTPVGKDWAFGQFEGKYSVKDSKKLRLLFTIRIFITNRNCHRKFVKNRHLLVKNAKIQSKHKQINTKHNQKVVSVIS